MTKEHIVNNNQIKLIALASLALLGACATSTTPRVDEKFGESMTILKAQQTLDTNASRNNNDPVLGIDGRAAKGALDNYRESFRKPPAEFANLPIFGGVGGAGGKDNR